MQEEIIIRKKYHDQLLPFQGKPLIKVLTGQRRVGKSYILKQTIQGIEQEDGEFLFLECNPRFGGASSLSIAAGLDTFTYFFKEALGESLENIPFHREPKSLRLIRYPKDLYVKWES